MTIEQMVFMLANYRKTNISDLARRIGMSRQNLHQKLKRGTLNKDDMSKIAETFGCRYVSCFVIPGGVIIGDRVKTRRLVKPVKGSYNKGAEEKWD